MCQWAMVLFVLSIRFIMRPINVFQKKILETQWVMFLIMVIVMFNEFRNKSNNMRKLRWKCNSSRYLRH